MQTLRIQFYTEFPGTEFKSIDFSDTSPEFKNIRLEATTEGDCGHHIFVEKLAANFHPKSLRPVVDEALREARLFIYTFAAASDLKFYNFRCDGYLSSGKLHSLESLRQRGGIGMVMNARMVVSQGKPTIDKIKAWLAQPHDISRLHLFFAASCLADPVSRYLSLYTALLHVCGDNQGKVDEEILAIDQTVQQSRQPHKPNIFETIFSRLRNEMSHARPNCSLLQTHDVIVANVDRFEMLVRKIMIR
jgi:hypothetical protein